MCRGRQTCSLQLANYLLTLLLLDAKSHVSRVTNPVFEDLVQVFCAEQSGLSYIDVTCRKVKLVCVCARALQCGLDVI